MGNKTANKRLLFVGGDIRQLRAANRVAKHGFDVSALGFDDCSFGFESICLLDDKDEYEWNFDGIILPLPYSYDGEYINAPMSKKKIKLENIFKNLAPDGFVLAGKCDKTLKTISQKSGLELTDYFEREELQILNAIPTAEGAVQIAMEEVPYTLHSSKCLIIGNGRIGKILSNMLLGLGADVTVAARKPKDRIWAYAYGCKSASTEDLYEIIGSFDIIFNTAPSMILDHELLSATRRDTLIIDLASKPGGTDFDSARKMGIKVIWALSLPGKVAPQTAGDIIGRTILNILDELEAKK